MNTALRSPPMVDYNDGDMEFENVYTVKQAAEILDVGDQRVRDLIQEGRLEAEKIGQMWFVDKASVDNFEKLPVGRPRKSEDKSLD